MKYCALQFIGQMQSYGSTISFNTGDHLTEDFPTRSSITGMICRGLEKFGEQIDFLKQIQEHIGINIYCFKNENKMSDFQILGCSNNLLMQLKNFDNGSLKNKCFKKYFLVEHKFGIVLFSENEILLDEIINAFDNPKYVLYYGRKNCIVNHNMFLGKFNNLNECFSCFENNNLKKCVFEVTEKDNSSDISRVLNDIPIKFGGKIEYLPRTVFIKYYTTGE